MKLSEFNLEKSYLNLDQNYEYIGMKRDLEAIFDAKVEGSRIRSKCTEYEFGGKSSKYFFNLEKRNTKLSTISVLANEDGSEIKYQNNQNHEIHNFYKKLFSENNNVSPENCNLYFENYEMKSLTSGEQELCNKLLSVNELYESLKEMDDWNSPGNDGLSSEFYKKLWSFIKVPLYASVVQAKMCGELTISQRQAIIK